VVSKAVGAGVTQMVLISTNAKNSAWSVEECAKRERSLYTMVGVHPYKAASSPLEEITKFKELAASRFCVAIGSEPSVLCRCVTCLC
jgi:Tat protein secretion system quality control protein TatD with DNase activity